MIAEPLPGLPLIESPFYGAASNASRDLILLRPATESESAVGTWSRGWSPEPDAIPEEGDEGEESDEISRVLPGASADEQTAPRVSFYLVAQINESIRRRFMTDLLTQGFPLHDAGIRDDDPQGLRGWVSLRHGVSRNEWLRLISWLRCHPAVRELSQMIEDGLA